MTKAIFHGNLNRYPVLMRLERVLGKRGTLTSLQLSGVKNLLKTAKTAILRIRWMFVQIILYFSNTCVCGRLNLSSIADSKKSTAKMFGDDGLNEIILVIEPLLVDSDKYKQRAGAEILSGILRGE